MITDHKQFTKICTHDIYQAADCTNHKQKQRGISTTKTATRNTIKKNRAEQRTEREIKGKIFAQHNNCGVAHIHKTKTNCFPVPTYFLKQATI